MTYRLGLAGRRARGLALARIQGAEPVRSPAPTVLAIPDDPLPLVQRAAPSGSPAESVGGSPPSQPAETGAAAIERETHPPTPEEVTERVYHLFSQDLRRERERRGRW